MIVIVMVLRVWRSFATLNQPSQIVLNFVIFIKKLGLCGNKALIFSFQMEDIAWRGWTERNSVHWAYSVCIESAELTAARTHTGSSSAM